MLAILSSTPKVNLTPESNTLQTIILCHLELLPRLHPFNLKVHASSTKVTYRFYLCFEKLFCLDYLVCQHKLNNILIKERNFFPLEPLLRSHLRVK